MRFSPARFAVHSLVLFALAGAGSRAAAQTAARQEPRPAAAPMPFDVGFTRIALSARQRVAVARDGRHVAFTVHENPLKSTAGVRILPNGVPGSIPDTRIFVNDTATGKSTRIAPDGGNCWRPSFSPDGKSLAFYCDAGGFPRLWVYDMEKSTARKVADAPVKPKVWAGDEPDWSPDGKEIFVPLAPASALQGAASAAIAGMDEPGMEVSKGRDGPSVTVHRAGADLPAASDPKQGGKGGAETEGFALQMRWNNAAMAAVEVSTGRVRVLVPEDSNPPPSVLQVSPSGKWVAYLSVFRKPSTIQSLEAQDLAIVPAGGGAPSVRVVAAAIPLSADYLLGAYAWHPTRDQLFWVKDGKLWTSDIAGDSASPRRLGDRLGEITPGVMAVTRNGKSIVVGVQPFDHPTYEDPHPRALAVVPVDGGGTPVLLPIPPGLEFQSVVRQRGWTLWQPREDGITALCRDKTGDTVALRLDLATGRSSELWRGRAQIHVQGAAADHGPLYVTFEDMNTPENVYRFAPDFSSKARISDVDPRLAGLRFGPVETFETPVHRHDDSLAQTVTSSVLLPPGAKAGDRLPAIVFVYPRHDYIASTAEFGGGSPATVPAALFTTRGYAVVLTDAPVRPLGQVGNFISDLADVIVPQVQHAADLGYIDIARVAVSGQSFGAYSTAALLSATNLFCAGIANAGSYDLLYLYFHMGPAGGYGYPPGTIENYWNMRTPFDDLPRWEDASPFFRAERIRAPLMIVIGTEDPICPVEDSRRMFNALRSLGRTVQLTEYAGEGHVLSDWAPVNAADGARRMLEFMDKYVKNPPAPSIKETSAK